MADIFDILGPIMVGPSSSHTAGAARIGKMGRILLGEEVRQARILLHGSFATTGRGHGTDRALLAGLLGMNPDDMRIPFAFEEAEKAGLRYSFEKTELHGAHPNTVVLELVGESGKTLQMRASSVGGGQILVNELDGIEVEFDGHFNTLVIHNQDEFGTIAEVTRLLSNYRINIANMRLSRHRKGGEALMVIETDQAVEPRLIEWIAAFPGILKVTYYDKREERDNA
ncbi:MAG: L-serine ammonia-lyase, iron-sulfur-dependent subunit beta [Oscillospiraceae bacterium]